MSFRCAECGNVARQGKMIVRETRNKIYTEKRFERNREVEVQVGAGYETVREERVCLDCCSEETDVVPLPVLVRSAFAPEAV